MPTYQFTQPISNQAAMGSFSNYNSTYAPTPMTQPIYHQTSSMPQVSLQEFMAQSSSPARQQNVLSEEEQLRLLEEFEMDNAWTSFNSIVVLFILLVVQSYK